MIVIKQFCFSLGEDEPVLNCLTDLNKNQIRFYQVNCIDKLLKSSKNSIKVLKIQKKVLNKF